MYGRGCVFMNVDVGVNVVVCMNVEVRINVDACMNDAHMNVDVCLYVNVIIYPVNSLFLFRQG